MSFRHGGERFVRKLNKEKSLRHGWGGNDKRRKEKLREKRALEEEKENHPYTSRKFKGDKGRDLTPEDRELFKKMKSV